MQLMKKTLLLCMLCFFVIQAHAQKKDFFQNFQGIKNANAVFYNVYGTTITTETFSYGFHEKGLKKIFRKYKFNFKKTPKKQDPKLALQHYVVRDSTLVKNRYVSFDDVFFVKNEEDISVIYFNEISKTTPQFKREFIRAYIENRIPTAIFTPSKVDSILFVNRYIKLGPSCRWMGVRNVQCSSRGQMDWSIHQTLEKATEHTKLRAFINRYQKKLKLISKDTIAVRFEGKKTKAVKMVYHVKGVNSLVLKMSSGAKQLIVYYIVQEVKGKNISCILSHWDIDQIRPNGLPALLSEVMQLEEN